MVLPDRFTVVGNSIKKDHVIVAHDKIIGKKVWVKCNLSDNEKIVELIIFNRSRHTEEDIKVNLRPGLKYQLIASDSTDTSLNASQIRIERVSQKSDYSLLLSVEGAYIHDDIVKGLSSKSIKGKQFAYLEGVPPTWGKLFLQTLGFSIPLILAICALVIVLSNMIKSEIKSAILPTDAQILSKVLNPRDEPKMQGNTNGDLLQWAISLRLAFRLAEVDKLYAKQWVEGKTVGERTLNHAETASSSNVADDLKIPSEIKLNATVPDSIVELLNEPINGRPGGGTDGED